MHRIAFSGKLSGLMFAFAACFSSGCASTHKDSMAYEVETREVRYSVGDTELTGFLASPRASTKPRPAVLIVHEWWGHNDYVRKRAQQLAAIGYPAFALDMYGTGKVASHPQDAQAFMQEVMGNKDTMEQRFRAAYDVLRNTAGVDTNRIAAIGYCMGGGIVLRIARTTDLLTAAASFHGSLGAAVDLDNANGHTKRIFIAQGGDDPFVPEDVFDKLKTQIRGNTEGLVAATYEGAKHGFTNPDATAKGREFGLPLAYDAKADASSWTTLMEVLHDAFGDGLRLHDSR